MIEQVVLKNFQAHKDTTVRLVKGINAFIGSSTAGKTSILRSINWALTNRPSGNVYVNYDNRDKKGNPVGETSVEIEFNDHIVKRIKTDKRNGYDADGQELSCVSTDVPELVTTAFRMDSLNVHKQLEPHFMLSESPGEVARYLNSLVGLSMIDSLLSKADKAQRQNKASYEATKASLLNHQSEVGKLHYLEEATKLLTSYDELDGIISDVSGKAVGLYATVEGYKSRKDFIDLNKGIVSIATSLVDDYSKYDSDIKGVVEIGKGLKETVEAIEKYNKVLENKKAVEVAKEYIDLYSDVNSTLRDYSESVDVLQGLIKVYKSYSNVLELKDTIETAVDLIDRYDYYDAKLDKIIDDSSAIEKLTNSYEINKAWLEELKAELVIKLALLPEICPTCGQSIGGR